MTGAAEDGVVMVAGVVECVPATVVEACCCGPCIMLRNFFVLSSDIFFNFEEDSISVC